jgi:hypothetical protein
MTVLTALARVAAAAGGRAVPTKTLRHVHLSARPLVLVAAQLAGEACAPLAVLVGDDRDQPRLLVVYEPRNRAQRFAFAADLADIVLPLIERHCIDEHGTDDTVASSPVVSSPVASSPVAPTAVVSSPVVSSPVAPTAVVSSPVASSPVAPTAVVSSPVVSSPVAPTTVISSPVTPGTVTPGTVTPGTVTPAAGTERSEPYPDAPQLLVPNPPTAAFVRLLGRSTRFRRTEGEYAVPVSVPLLGRWLTYFTERSEVSPSAQLLPMTAVLADHWATGQSAAEDANLGALLAWIDHPDGMTGQEAARAAEDPVRCPPAGPVTDPTFDNEVLEPILRVAREATLAGDSARLRLARADLERALRSQLEPTWRQMWRAVDLLNALPAAASVEKRWLADRWSFTSQVAWIRDGGAPQARRDSAVAAARRLARLEREQQRLAVERAYDDPLVMAEYRMTGEAFAGDVTDAQPDRIDTAGKKAVRRPWITVETTDEVLFQAGQVLKSPARTRQEATVKDVVASGDGRTQVVLELKGGMGQSLRTPPPPGSLPHLGEWITYTSLMDDFQREPKFPERENTPWTHGGPPPEYVPNDSDAREDWS